MNTVQHVEALINAPDPVEPDGLEPVRHGKFTFTSQGLVVDTTDGEPTFEEWGQAMHTVAVLVRGIAFLVGDLIRYGEARFGEMAAQIIDARSWQPETVRVYKWLAENVPMENRMLDRGLSVKHHQIVGKLPEQEQRKWLRLALNDGGEPWTTARLGQAIKNGSDMTPSRFFVLVEARSERVRDELQKKLELDGYFCKAVERR
jgi:hypothetical protein